MSKVGFNVIVVAETVRYLQAKVLLEPVREQFILINAE